MVGPNPGDCVALQLRSSLPKFLGFTYTVASVGTVRSGEVEQSTDVRELDGVRTEGAVKVP